MSSCTVFQDHLKKRSIPWLDIRQRLRVHRTAPSQWARGVIFPNKPNADALIKLFAERGIKLDYNDIYQYRALDTAMDKPMEEAS